MNSGVSGWDSSCKDLVALMDVKIHQMRQTLWTAHHVLFAFTISEMSGGFFFFFVFFYYMLHAITQTRSRGNFNQWLLKEAGGSKGLTAFQRDIRPEDLWSKWFIFAESGRKHLQPQVWAQSSERTRCTSSRGCRVLKMIICCIIEKVKSIWVHFFKENNVPWPEPQEYENVRTAWKGESTVNTELLYCCVSGWKPTKLKLVFQIFLRYEHT